MMDINKTEEIHAEVAELLRNEQLLAALEKMKLLVNEASDWNLRSEYDNIAETYDRMLHFIERDMADPDRGVIYYNMLMKGLTLNDRLLRIIHMQVGTTLYYKTLREVFRLPQARTMHELSEWIGDETIGNEKMQTLFNILWTSDVWSPNDREIAVSLINRLPENVASLCVSAVTMAFIHLYDPQKFLSLFDLYTHPATVVNQRAIAGIAIGCMVHDNRMRNNHEIVHCAELREEDSVFRKALEEVQMQILRARETEKISKFMNEEFIPEMMKNPILKKDKTGLDSLAAEDSMNPEWEKWIESKDVKNKMNIMNELYTTGADIHMASFANMKNFPFFREISNWFLPFDAQHPAISSITSQEQEDSQMTFFKRMIESSEFCDSDCYSLYLFLASLPQNTRQMMGRQVPTLSEEIKEQLEELNKKQGSPEQVCKKYIQNLYRFYKLFSRRHEFTDIFNEEANLQYCDTLAGLLDSSTHINDVAAFLFKEKRYDEASDMFHALEMKTLPTFETAQKRGFCMQQLGQYEEAIGQYKQADLMHPDNLWTLIHLAQCYNTLEQVEEATSYYLKAEAIAPDDLSLQLQVGNCLGKLGHYDEAFKRFFKVHYLDESSITVWRAIAWYSLMAGKMEQAARFYKLIEESGKGNNAGDLLNMGHLHWLDKHYNKAISYYKQCLQLTDKEQFRELMMSDADSLLQAGIPMMDIPLIIDLVER